jgi:hypothetical protein
LIQRLRTGSEIQLRWLSELRRKTKHLLTQVQILLTNLFDDSHALL